MPKWNFPVSLPQFTDEEFEQQQAEYVAEHGYYVSPPKLGDIIHIRTYDQPDSAEFEKWKVRARVEYLITRYPTSTYVPTWQDQAQAAIRDRRYFDIKDLLEKQRARRDRMLASPMPTFGKNIASVLTFFDDINDTLGSAAVLGRFAARLMPRVLGRLMLGPIGWLLLLADIAGLVLDIMRMPIACIAGKRMYEGVRDMNPFSKNARVRRANKLRRVLPGKGELLELAQTTDNVFGIGLCLGPILGYGYDVAAGLVRAVRGQKVTWTSPPPPKPTFMQSQQRTLRFAQMLHLAGEEMTDEDHLSMMLALNGATQLMKPWIDEWNPIDQVQGLQHALLIAPTPIYPTTRYILQEIGIGPGERIGWPGLDKTHATIKELWDTCQSTAAARFMDFAKRNRNNYNGACGCQNGYEFGKNMMLMLEGYETVLEEMTPAWQGYYNFFTGGCVLTACGSVARGGCTDSREHIIPFGRSLLHIAGCAHDTRYTSKRLKNDHLTLVCRDCEIVIPSSLCPPGFQNWVASVAVVPHY
ncbi:hypothetical protein ES702_06882 [subsurface metagenome]